MLELGLALVALGVVLLLTVLLPILSFVRAQQAQRTARALQQRLSELEAAVAGLTAAPAPSGQPEQAAGAGAAALAPLTFEPAPTPVPPANPPATPMELVPPVEAPVPDREPPIAVADGAPASGAEDFEQQIGSRWLLYAGVAAVVLGMSYFVKFAFDNGWIGEPLRVIAGAATGVTLVAMGLRFWSRGLATFGQALAGGGIVVLYVSVYAALHFYGLIPRAPAFGLMALVTAIATWLADRQRSQLLAALALVGGFATPILVGGDRGAQVVLFTYIAILVGGSAVVARRHAWPLLSAGSYLCTFLLVLSWFFESYDAAHWLRTELFLTLYAALFAYLLWALLASGTSSPQAGLAAAALATAPLAYHVASIALLNEHPGAWLVYLVLATVAGLVASQRTRAAWLRVAALLLVGLPALAWLTNLAYPRWYTAAVATALAVYVLHLVAQWEAIDSGGFGRRSPGEGAGEDRGLPVIEALHTQLNGLLLPLSLYLFLETRASIWNPRMLWALAVWNATLAAGTRRGGPHMSLQFMALSATLAAAAIVLAFDGPAVSVGWAAEGIFVGWLALRERSRWLAFGSAVLLALGSLQLVQLLALPLPVRDRPLLNSRALAAGVVIGLLAWLATRMRKDPVADVRGRARNAVVVLANLLSVLLMSAEIHAYFSQRIAYVVTGVDGPFPATEASLAEQLTLSVGWALYAVVLVAVGIRRRYAPARYFAIALFGVTVVKVLVNDIAGLDRLYRMLSVLGVGVLLLVASYLYQRRAIESRRDEG